MANQQYEAATVFNARIVDMRHLWEPSREYQGKPLEKPNYFAKFIVPKTQAQWHMEPALAGITAACGKLYQTNPHVITWPVVDGDMPSPQGKTSEFAKGHWLFSASTSNPPNIEIVQAGGVLTKLTQKVGVKSGDYVMAGVTAAVKQNDARGVKLYLNAVVFSGPGEEIVFANSVSGAELMRMAEQQGLRPAGFSGSPGGFQPGQSAGPFGQPNQQPGFVPPQGNHAPFGAPGQNAPPPISTTAFPSSGAPAFGAPPAGSFGAPPVGPFGPR